MVSVQREITPDSRVGLSACFSGVDLSQSQEALVGQSSGRQEPAYESISGLYEIRHPWHAQPCQCTDTPTAHVLCITVSGAYLKRKVKRGASNIVCWGWYHRDMAVKEICAIEKSRNWLWIGGSR